MATPTDAESRGGPGGTDGPPAPPAPTPSTPIGDVPPSTRSTGRGTRWALAGLTAVGLSYVYVVDPNKPNLVPACPFRALTGLDCPGCGGTRAVHALLHGDVASALNHNVLAVAAVVIGIVWFVWNRIADRRGRPRPRFSLTTPWAIVLFVAIGAFWVARNLPWWPLSWLGSGN